MAATSSAPRKKFDLANPGGREYLIVGGVVLAAALVYFYLKKRTAAATAADTTGTGDTSGPSTPTGLTTGQLLAWIQDHQSSTTTTTTGGGGGTTGGSGGSGSPGTGSKTPDYWQTAIDLLKKQGNTHPTHAQIEKEYVKITPLAQRKKEEAFNKAHGKK